MSVDSRQFRDLDQSKFMIGVCENPPFKSGLRASARTFGKNAPLRAKAHRRGFTLVEVLATLVLLGIILPAVMKATTLSLAAASSARHTTEATDLGQSKLHDLIAEDLWDQVTSGDFSPDYPQYKWQVTSTPLGDYGIDNVQLTVTWSEAGRPRSLSLTTLAYDTTTDNGTGTETTSGGPLP